MLHLGDITKVSGYTAPIVDCVVGGSPCQDLSVAGKRAGLDGERSGLFMDQVRIVKEMRERDERDNGRTGVDVRPRYMVWENVPGAFSSNKGEDFRIVLEEIARVKDQAAVIPQPDKWQTSGCILGDGWSIAWRVLDAQFWGVPQRRRRIALVADFGGHSASEILFVRKSVSGHTGSCESKRKATPADATRSVGANDCLGADQYNAVILGDTVSTLGVNCGMSHGRQCVLKPTLMDAYQHHGYRESDTCGTLTAGQNDSIRGDTPLVASPVYSIDGDKLNKKERDGGSGMGIREGSQYTLTAKDVHGVVYSVENHPADSRVDIDDTGKVQTLTSRMGTGGGNVPMVLEPTVFSKSKRAQNPTDYETWQESDTANTLNTFDQGDVRTNECVIAMDRASYNQCKNAQYDFDINDGGSDSTIVAKGPSAVCYSHTKVGAFYPQMKAESQCFRTDGISNCLVNGTNPGFQNGVVTKAEAWCIGNGQLHDAMTPSKEVCNTINCMHDKMAIMSVDCRNGTEDDVNGALQSMASNNINSNNVVRTRYTVRRLTPLECERLQGYPDGWTLIGEPVEKDVTDYIVVFDESKYIKPNYEDFGLSWDDVNDYNQMDEEDIDDDRYFAYQRALIRAKTKATKKFKVGSHKETHYYYTNHKGKKVRCTDAARYKALGNSIAIPPWKWVMKRLCACYERDATLASLFSGIGGFDLIWTQLNGYGSVLWEAEIEDYPSAVCKRHFGDEATGERGDLYEYLH